MYTHLESIAGGTRGTGWKDGPARRKGSQAKDSPLSRTSLRGCLCAHAEPRHAAGLERGVSMSPSAHGPGPQMLLQLLPPQVYGFTSLASHAKSWARHTNGLNLG